VQNVKLSSKAFDSLSTMLLGNKDYDLVVQLMDLYLKRIPTEEEKNSMSNKQRQNSKNDGKALKNVESPVNSKPFNAGLVALEKVKNSNINLQF
jgi:hypothetical protein